MWSKGKKSPIVKDTALAFVIGGLICVLGQAIQTAWGAAGLGKEDAGTATSCTLVFLRPADGPESLQQAGALRRRGNSGADHRFCKCRGLPCHRL